MSAKGVLTLVRSIRFNLKSASRSSSDGRRPCSSMVSRPMGAGMIVSGPHTPKISDMLDPRLPIDLRLSVEALNAATLKTLTDFQSMMLKILKVAVDCFIVEGRLLLDSGAEETRKVGNTDAKTSSCGEGDI
jgi:hypothetical protein